MGDVASVKPEPGSNLAFQSKSLEELLNVVDDLRLQGISGMIDLPQIVVCGDQSSGKSSVLEAISGVHFPTKDNLCTRYPTELILRREPEIEAPQIKITILPDANRSEEDKNKLRKFKAGSEALKDFGTIIEEAGKSMGIGDNGRTFCTDVLRVEVTGPDLTPLTLVDLPGLFHSANKFQSEDDIKIVRELVTGYMKKPRSIILAVVSAKNDYANQVVTKHARSVDPHGQRTMGIITKPDLLHKGSPSERQYLEMLENKDVHLRLGWHALKNRDYNERDISLDQRNRSEAEFFSKGVWTALSPSQTGIEALKSRLSRVLRDHILTELPNLTRDVESGIKDCESRIGRLGVPRGTLSEQRRYLHKISQEFGKTVQSAVDGYYHEGYFDDSSSESYPKRIRAVVANLLDDFAKTMRVSGKSYVVTNRAVSETASDAEDEVDGPEKVTQEERLDRVAELLRENRGRELPGFTKFEIVTTLFRDQCRPWQGLIEASAENIFDAVRLAVHLALNHSSDQTTKEGILHFVVNPALDEIKAGLDARVCQNLQQHVKGHPITFNHYFTDNVQKLRNKHQAEFLEKKVLRFLGRTRQQLNIRDNHAFIPRDLIASLTNTTEADMNVFACSEALHFMDAYYKVALKFFVDDFSIHTIEQGLLEQLKTIFEPSKVFALTDDDVEAIAGESEEGRAERATSSARLAKLTEALKLLRKLDRGHVKREE